MNYLYATTNIGCEQLLAFELNSLGAKNLNITEGGVYYEGEDLLLYQSLIWSRVASRIFICIKKFSIQNSKDLYVKTYHINWDEIIYLNKTFLINFKGNNNIIPNNSLGELTIKKAIFDQFYKKYSIAPNVNLINPDIKIYVISIYNTINIMLDLSGDSLDKRGYGKFINNKSIKENLSAAIVLSSSWKKNYPLIDPICGLGTLLIEAAMIYSDRAPGLKRKKWGFQYWKGYNKVLWYKVVDHANMRFEKKLKNVQKIYL